MKFESQEVRFYFHSLPVVWLGRFLEKSYTYSIPANDNDWKFGTGPDTLRKLLAEEARK